MSYVDHIIRAFGGVRALARAVDKPASNVSGWKERGTMPDSQKVLVHAAARRLGISLTSFDFLPYELRRPAPSDHHNTATSEAAQ